jgi:hypothetical protein
MFSFLVNTLILPLAYWLLGGTMFIEPLPGNGRLWYFPTSIFRLLGGTPQYYHVHGLVSAGCSDFKVCIPNWPFHLLYGFTLLLFSVYPH